MVAMPMRPAERARRVVKGESRGPQRTASAREHRPIASLWAASARDVRHQYVIYTYRLHTIGYRRGMNLRLSA